MPRVHAPAGYGIEEALNITRSCVPAGKASFVKTSRAAMCAFGSAGSFRTPRRGVPTFLSLRRQSEVQGLRRMGCVGAIGRPARSLAAKSQTNLVLASAFGK